jgi:hypothetical protein
MSDLEDLAAALRKASGADSAVDHEIAERFAVASADYSASIEQCRLLASQLAPGWRLHVGYAANGIFPYASLSKDDQIFEDEAPTVPLAILKSLICGFCSRESGQTTSASVQQNHSPEKASP